MTYKSGSPPAAFIYGIKTMVTCIEGYRFADLETNKSLICEANGVWIWTSISICQGRLISSLYSKFEKSVFALCKQR